MLSSPTGLALLYPSMWQCSTGHQAREKSCWREPEVLQVVHRLCLVDGDTNAEDLAKGATYLTSILKIVGSEPAVQTLLPIKRDSFPNPIYCRMNGLVDAQNQRALWMCPVHEGPQTISWQHPSHLQKSKKTQALFQSRNLGSGQVSPSCRIYSQHPQKKSLTHPVLAAGRVLLMGWEQSGPKETPVWSDAWLFILIFSLLCP